MPGSPNTEIDPDFRDMLGLLLKNNVEFVLVGGHALAAHGRPRFTKDIDFFIRPTSANAHRLWQTLAEFGAPLGDLSPADFANPQMVVQFGAPPQRIDFLMSIDGVSFEDAWRDRVVTPFAGVDVPVLSREHLVRNKRATGRGQDQVDADDLDAQR